MLGASAIIYPRRGAGGCRKRVLSFADCLAKRSVVAPVGRAGMSATTSKRSSRLGRLSVLAPAALSACMDASVLAVPAAGAIVSTVLKELSKAFMLKRWFHGSMSAKEAEHLMMDKGKHGSFLVRESQAHPGEFVLSVRSGDRVSHVMIRRQDDKYEVGSGEQFEDLVGLIEHLRTYPMVEASGEVLRLLQPVSGARLRVPDSVRRRRPALSQAQCPVAVVPRKSSGSSSSSGGGSGGEEGLDEEFRQLQVLDQRLGRTTREGERPENQCKNRYRNVLPFDETRVVLRNGGSGDYINASYVRPRRATSASPLHSSEESLHSVQSLTLHTKEKRPVVPLVSKSLSDDVMKEVKKCMKLDRINGNSDQQPGKNKLYIATQGCLSNTKEDFWHMVWQEDVRIIVMITNEVERGKKKCEKYWPQSGSTELYGDIAVKCESEQCLGDYMLRELAVQVGCSSRTIHHYQFTAWPDHGTPAAADSLLAFIDDVNERLRLVARAHDPPLQEVICVHCSAGVGRTGTFIVLDMVLDQLKASQARWCGSEVRAAVRTARAQRPGMVQNAAQYAFVHRALAAHAERARNTTHKLYSIEA